MKDKDGLRKEIAQHFRKHCSPCTGSCCNVELEEGFMAFRYEADKLQPTHRRDCGRVSFVSFNNDRCEYSGSQACRLDLSDRPLDCLSYPVYPSIRFKEDGGKEVDGLVVRRYCPSSKSISEDAELLGLIREFWELTADDIPAADLQEWFSDREYWSEKNLIRV